LAEIAVAEVCGQFTNTEEREQPPLERYQRNVDENVEKAKQIL
jgi:hypothetical protein